MTLLIFGPSAEIMDIFLKGNGVWSQSPNVKPSSATLKAHIASALDTLLCNGTSKVNDGWGFDKEVEKTAFCVLFSPNLISDTSSCFLTTECWVNVWNRWVEYFKSQLQREYLA